MKRYKLAIVASHPIQYQAPLFRYLAQDPRLDVTVYYCWDFGISEAGFDKELGVKVKWDVPLLDGYKYVLLKNYSSKPGTSFFGQINPSIVGELRKNKYDAALIHGYTTVTSWLIFFTRWYTGAKIILRGEANMGKRNGTMKNLVKLLVLKNLFKTIPAFLYSYRLNKEFFTHYGVPEEKLFFFPCAVDNDFFGRKFEELKLKKNELKKSIGIKNLEAPTFIFIGKLMKRKRTFDILKACELLRENTEFNVLFVGDGEDRKALEKYVRERGIKNIYFLGFKNQSEIPVYYAVSDILLLPSEFDPSPKQVNEAMNFGIAFIISDRVGTAPDLIADSGCGFIYEFGDVNALAGHMEKLATDAALLQRCRENSLRTVAKWSYREDADGILTAIKSINSEYKDVRINFSTMGKHHFFGYYDKCPWDMAGGKILAHEADFINRLPDGKEIARIGFFRPAEAGHFNGIAETRAWNWQQGSMLQWLGPDYNRKIIFNDLQNGRFVSVIFDIAAGERKIIPFPIYAVHSNGRRALSLNFSRLNDAREGYGYKGVKDPSVSEDKPKDDGIYFVDLERGERGLAISLAKLCERRHLDSMNEGKHWVDHLTFSPSGARFAFLHRWRLKNGGMYSRLYTADSDGSSLHLLLDSGMASHFTWKSDHELLVWGRPPGVAARAGASSLLRKFAVPVYHGLFRVSGRIRQVISGDAFLLFEDKTRNFKKIGAGLIREDGHCSFSPNGEWLLTDTYPGNEHYRHLMLFNLSSGGLIEIGKFYSLPAQEYGVRDDWDLSNLRADLHPRFNRDGARICFDSVHEGSRQIYVCDTLKK